MPNSWRRPIVRDIQEESAVEIQARCEIAGRAYRARNAAPVRIARDMGYLAVTDSKLDDHYFRERNLAR